ncbi:MAG: asparagine synthase (glutamine-hydrolyzing) [Bacteroidota bacterium]
MCGIHLIIDKKSKLQDSSSIEKMLAQSHYRGPDQQAFIKKTVNGSQLFFGTNRLSITDVSPIANQPYTPENEDLLCFNGELYNNNEVRNALSESVKIKSRSDTELVFSAFREKSMDALSTFNGMFALIYFNNTGKKIFLTRDTAGMKPLFFYSDENYFIASSEIKSIITSRLIKPELNASVIPHYLAFRYAPAPNTFYKRVFEVMPGEIKEIDLKSNASSESRTFHFRSKKSEEKNLKSILLNATERHLSGLFQPILFLSGGVDSSLILALTHELGHENFPAISVEFDEPSRRYSTSDYKYAQLAAKKYQADFHSLKLHINSLDDVPGFLTETNQPIADNASFLTHLLSKQASELNYKVALSGAGADELFAGYNRHWVYYKYLQNPFLFKLLTNSFKPLEHISKVISKSLFEKVRQYQKVKEALSLHKENPYLGFCMLTEFMSQYKAEANDPVIVKTLSEALQFDEKNYLVNDVLLMTDEQSMSSSLEVRMPFLDQAVIQFAHSMPEDKKLRHGKKWMLKELLERLGLPEIAKRPKEGFGMPLNHWFRQRKGLELINILQEKSNPLHEFVSYSYIQSLVKNHENGKQDHSAALWSLLTLHFWLRQNF